jgi:hypothetical protein
MSEASLSIPKHVLSESLQDETVVLDMSTGVYFGLSPVASRIWKLLASGSSRLEIEAALLAEFDVEPTVLASDLDNLLTQLEGKKLIVRAAN